MSLLPVKVVCRCGQKYSFEVEPVNGRMPQTIACPVCGADGTASANEIIARSLSVSPPPRPAPSLAPAPAPSLAPAPAPAYAPAPVPVGAARTQTAAAPPPAPVAPLAPAARPTAAEGISRIARELKAHAGEEEEDKWKWWYYILAGICIGGYSIWQFYNTHQPKVLGELFISVLAIAIGVWSYKSKRKKQQ
ncbi:MAG TPA: hypothetical protein VK815_04640 [Candidatus Acidoferrales bacterium]|jgi:hypothetical protein|nr:hypothetical protein [Candidatus Acidoferrales bacterium]